MSILSSVNTFNKSHPDSTSVIEKFSGVKLRSMRRVESQDGPQSITSPSSLEDPLDCDWSKTLNNAESPDLSVAGGG